MHGLHALVRQRARSRPGTSPAIRPTPLPCDCGTLLSILIEPFYRSASYTLLGNKSKRGMLFVVTVGACALAGGVKLGQLRSARSGSSAWPILSSSGAQKGTHFIRCTMGRLLTSGARFRKGGVGAQPPLLPLPLLRGSGAAPAKPPATLFPWRRHGAKRLRRVSLSPLKRGMSVVQCRGGVWVTWCVSDIWTFD